MVRFRVGVTLALLLLAHGSVVHAQSTTGTIAGAVLDTQDQPMPGVTVTVESSNLQGVRTTMTAENGNFTLSLLPPGAYTITFEVSGFERQQRAVTVSPTQVVPLQITLGLAGVSERVDVVAPQSAEPLMRTTQVATTFSQELMSTLPTTRDLNASLLMSSAVHPTGPNGSYSIAGATSYENLFLINGVTVNENIRGQAHDLYIEDAIETTTIAAAGISAEYGRFGGGVVNVITKSGGNDLSGSFRSTLQNDKWRTHTPFEEKAIENDPNHRDTRVADLLPTYEYTLGGPILRDRLWFFTAGRFQQQEAGRQTTLTLINYQFSDEQQRYEAKATGTINANNRLQVAFTKYLQDQTNSSSISPTGVNLLDLRSLHNPSRRMDLLTLEYNTVLTSNLFVEARASARNETTTGQGAASRDLIEGTLLIDGQRGYRYWSPTFCGVCTPEQRDNSDFFVKGTYFLPTTRAGSHDVTFGYDRFNDKRFANNHQSGSGYRLQTSGTLVRGTSDTAEVFPQFLPGGTARVGWNPILQETEGSDIRTHSLFVSDNWRVTPRLTANLGVRFDKNNGANSVGQVVANDSAWSPRLGVIFDPTGSNDWSVTGSLARYVAAVATTVADASSPGGNANGYQWVYNGPAINADPNGTLVPTADALRQVFDWFQSAGGTSLPLATAPTIRGVTPLIRESLTSPNVWEWATGVSRQFGSRASLRADFVYRDYHDFYAQRTDLTTGQVRDQDGRAYDLTLLENADVLTRKYTGVTFQGTYRAASRFDAGASYTASRAWGNVEGEAAGGPAATAALQYPEYKEAEWNYPTDELSIDQRHRARLWATYQTPWVDGLSVSVLQILESGIPYAALATVNSAAFVTNPGYLSAPPANLISYYFTGTDEFRTEGQRRTDLAANYRFRIPGARNLELFGQLQVLNAFNQFQLCACGASTVAQNGGSAAVAGRIDTTVRTSLTPNSGLTAFNPFTTTPERGVNWEYGPTFGQALSRLAYTTPRTLRVSFGVRF